MGKYALLLYGSLRSYKLSYKYLYNNLLSINDVDIFISTHNLPSLSSNLEKDSTSVKFENIYGYNLKNISYIEDIDQSYLITLIKEKIKVVDSDLYDLHTDEIEKITNLNDFYAFYGKLRNNNNQGFILKNKENYRYILHEIIMIYHRLNAFRLLESYSKKENIKYDGVIIYRPDLYFSIPLDLSKFVFNDQTIYFRLDFMLMSSFDGIKKLVTNLLHDFYCNKNIKYIEGLKNNSSYDIYISEHQHNMFIWNKEYYLNAFDILDTLIHYRALNGEGPDYILYVPIQQKINRKESFDLNTIISLHKESFNKTLNDINLKLTEK
jgi:hypothetical protein